jgi:prepilin-type N-terminal cleavage/methylation domain-containing protein
MVAWTRSGSLDEEDGMTLIEVVLTVAIVSIAFVAILTALGTMITTGALHHQLSRTEAAARNSVEYVKKPASYIDCATPAAYAISAANASLPSGYTAVVETVQVIDNPAATAPTYSSSTCPTSDPGVQRVTVRVCPHGTQDGSCTSSSKDSQTVQVIKRRPIT